MTYVALSTEQYDNLLAKADLVDTLQRKVETIELQLNLNKSQKLNITQAAKYLGISRSYLNVMRSKSPNKPASIPNPPKATDWKYYYTSDLDKWMDEQRGLGYADKIISGSKRKHETKRHATGN